MTKKSETPKNDKAINYEPLLCGVNYSEALIWTPKTVIIDGKKYDAPVNLLEYLTYQALHELLLDNAT